MATEDQFYHHLGKVWIAGGGGGASGTAIAADGTTVTIKSAAIAVATLGANTLVAAVVGKKIRVLAFSLSSGGVVSAKFTSGASPDLTGLFYLPAVGSSVNQPMSSGGLFETASGALLGLNLSANIAVGGFVSYIEV